MSDKEETGLSELRADYDGAWKEALELYLKPFLSLCFPFVVDEIDWTCDPAFHDKELQELVHGSHLGKQQVDKLVRVRLKSGHEKWVFIHVEVQSQRDKDLPLRLYRYHHRLVDHYGMPVATLVVLGDEEPSWRPGPYLEEFWQSLIYFSYPTCKLLDLENREDRPLLGDNPAAIVVAAHLAAKRTRGNVERRTKLKWILIRRLYKYGFDADKIRALFRLIDWMMVLPKDKNLELRRRISDYESKKMTPYITSIQRIGREEGREEGRREGQEEGRRTLRELIIEALETRFGEVPQGLQDELARIGDITQLKPLVRYASICACLEDFTNRINGGSS